MTILCAVRPGSDERRIEGLLAAAFAGDQIVFESGGAAAPDLVIAAGGDGTVNRLLPSIAGTGIPLAIVPGGRANDLGRALGIPGDGPAACRVASRGRPRAIDLLSVNGRYFATCGGFGLVSRVSARADAWRWKAPALRTLTYPLATLACIREGVDAVPVHLTLEGTGGFRTARESGDLAALVVCNQPRFGGCFAPCPRASNTDGLMDLSLIASPSTRGEMLRICAEIVLARGDRCRDTRWFRAREAVVETGQEVVFFADGDPVARGRRFELRVHPGALHVLTPGPAAHSLGARRGS